MISHVYIGVADFERAFAFYARVLAELGLVLKFREEEKPWAGWQAKDAPRPLFLIGRPYNGEAASPGNGQMVALLAPSREAVDRAYAAARGRPVCGRITTRIITAPISGIRMAPSSASAVTTPTDRGL